MDSITTVITTSSIPSNPSTEIIDRCIESIRKQIPDTKIVILCDGVRPELEFRTEEYEKFKKRIKTYTNIWVYESPKHIHQTGLIRFVLPEIKTKYILFMEHDFVLYGDIEWEQILKTLDDGSADLIRLYMEHKPVPEHRHLMLNPFNVNGIRLIPTGQWSQQPHIATTEYYKKAMGLIREHTVKHIENALYGYFDSSFQEHKRKFWEKHKLTIYYPEGDTSRVKHLDGRQGDPI